MKKIIIINILFFVLLTIEALAQNNSMLEERIKQELMKINFQGDFSLGYDYSFGFAKLENGKVLSNQGFLTLDERFRNSLYINDSNFALSSNFSELISANISGSLISRDFIPEPLYNFNSYKNYKEFFDERKNNIKYIWQRFGIIQDVNVVLNDSSVGGNLVIGQQFIPFNYEYNSTLLKPVSIYPLTTPMTDYINFNLRSENETPYQNSTLTRLRDIGLTLNGNYDRFRFYTGLYNGAGPNTFDNNNEKDLFGRIDVLFLPIGEFGVSHWRGRHITFKNIYSNTPERKEFEMYRTGIHGKLGNDNLYLLGEVIFSQDRWLDNTDADQLGWHIEGAATFGKILKGVLRYETFSDDNVLRREEGNTHFYSLKRFVATLKQQVFDNIQTTQEYSHTWEEIIGNNSQKLNTNYGIFSINLKIGF